MWFLSWRNFQRTQDPDEILQAVARTCQHFKVPFIAADGAGNGNVYNNLLLHQLPHLKALYAILYAVCDQKPQQYKGRLWNWSIGRTPSLGMVFARIKKRRILFPQLEDSCSFSDEIWCETAQYDEQLRSIKYTHPAGLRPMIPCMPSITSARWHVTRLMCSVNMVRSQIIKLDGSCGPIT